LPREFAAMPATVEEEAAKPATPHEDSKAYYFITLVKLAAGKTPSDFMKAVDTADELMKKAGKQMRHERGIHEERSFVTLGRHDLVVIWRAPDLKSATQYLYDMLEAHWPDAGTTETLVVIAQGVK
jgi:uncharacterized protein with GYD domain